MRLVDSILSRFTMYQVVFYLLGILLVASFGLVIFRALPYDPVLFVQNSAIIFATAYITNFVFSKLFKAYSNIQSTIITALILILITPIQFKLPIWLFILMPFAAIASKYLVAYKKVHIFNPAAFGVLIVGLIFPDYAATWWVGDKVLFIPVLTIGLLIVRKINRFQMVLTFLVVYAGMLLIGSSSLNTLWDSFTKSALIFFAIVMLTEPFTTPARKNVRIYYAVFVGVLYSIPLFNLTSFVVTPEIALLAGSLFSFAVNPKYRLDLKLKRKNKLTSDLYEFEFEKPKDFKFIPGQYMSWTLPHKKEDSRGNRRYFSLASSPTEEVVRIAFRKYEPSSSFKKALIELPENEKIIASSLSGDFVLPKDKSQNLTFIAGGIGITPFVSMVKYLVDKDIESNIILLYVVTSKEDLIFMDAFEKASKLGIKTIPLIGKYELEKDEITKNIPDYKNRAFYISGPQPMVQNFKDILKKIGVKNIKVDFFPGYS